MHLLYLLYGAALIVFHNIATPAKAATHDNEFLQLLVEPVKVQTLNSYETINNFFPLSLYLHRSLGRFEYTLLADVFFSFLFFIILDS